MECSAGGVHRFHVNKSNDPASESRSERQIIDEIVRLYSHVLASIWGLKNQVPFVDGIDKQRTERI